MNKNEWWDTVDKNWDNLKILINDFWGSQKTLSITAEAAESFRLSMQDNFPLDFDYEKAKSERDIKLWDFFNSLWWKIPESYNIWMYEGFGVLCDLCAEACDLFNDEI